MASADEIRSRMRELCARLNAASAAYYNGQPEVMSDHEWDALFDELKGLEARTGIVLPESPTHHVGADETAGRKEAHEYPALSLAKTKSVADVVKWAEGRPIWLSWKLDGLTLVVTYDGGRLTKVVTRGDGTIGTNITHLAAGIAGIPARIDAPGHLVIRGEAVISYADFEAFQATAREEFANPRNLASGSLSLKNVEELKPRHLRWIPFTLVHADEPIRSWGARMDYLASIGFTVVAHERIDAPTQANLQAALDAWTARVVDRENPYPVDGLVVVYDDTDYARTGSVTGHHATRAGLAFKWRDEEATTALDHVEWSCAVSAISPVAVFAPVSLEGTTVRRATLCNISECERLGVGGPGTGLVVIKANKIIPKVVRVARKVGDFAIPARCPVCGAATAVVESEGGTRKLVCTNAECPARTLARFVRFASKDGLDIDGLGGETLAKFVNAGWIKTPADILRLGAHAGEIAALEGFGEKSARNLCAALEKARHCEAVRFLVALSIPLCGPDVAKKLLGSVGSVRELVDKARISAPDAFATIEGIGPAKSAAFVGWMQAPAHRELVDELLGEMDLEMPARPAGGACAGLTFAITGDLVDYPNRAALKAYIESQGGKVAGSVSGKTSFLINNDAQSASEKNKKARALGIPILTEKEFEARFCT